MKRILFLKFGALGDVLMTTPLLRQTRKTFPGANIDYCVAEPFAIVLRDNPQAWASAISLTLDDVALRTRFAKAAAQTAECFDWNTRLIPQLNALFSEIATEQRSAITGTPCDVPDRTSTLA